MLIVTADDLGLDAAIDRGIMETVAAQAVNAVSLVANGASIATACAFVKKNPQLDAGVHLTLVGEQGLLLKLLPHSFKEFIVQYVLQKINLKIIAEELEAQIIALRNQGVLLRHADSHQHLHLLPGIAEVVVDLCVKYKIPRIRIVNEPLAVSVRSIPLLIMKLLSWRLQRLCAKQGLTTVDFFGFTTSMRVTPEIIARAQAAAKSADVELMCHPGYQSTAYPQWGMDWERERQVVLTALAGKQGQSWKQ